MAQQEAALMKAASFLHLYPQSISYVYLGTNSFIFMNIQEKKTHDAENGLLTPMTTSFTMEQDKNLG